MKTSSRLFAVAAMVLLAACGGGGDESDATSAGQIFSASPGVYVARPLLFSNLPRYFQVVLDDGETWIVSDYNVRGEPVFFASGKFQFAERVTRVTTTTTVTVTADRTVTETMPETIGMVSGVPVFSSITNFTAKDALITINSNILGTASITYCESLRPDQLLADSVGIVSPELGCSVVTRPSFRRGKADSFLDYSQAASVQRVSGMYRLQFGNQAITTVITADGTFNGTNPITGCLINGSLSPHPNGKNVFVLDVVLSNCQDAGNYKGIAAPYPAADPSGGVGLFDLVSPSGMQVPSLFLAAVDTKAGRAFSIVMNATVTSQ